MALRVHLVNVDNQDQKAKQDLWASKACQDREDSRDLRGNGEHLEKQACPARMADLDPKEKEGRLDRPVKLENKDPLVYLVHKVYPVQLGLEEREDHPGHQVHKVCLYFAFGSGKMHNRCYEIRLILT